RRRIPNSLYLYRQSTPRADCCLAALICRRYAQIWAIPGLFTRNHHSFLHTYLSSTFAPAFSSTPLIFSASSLVTPSLTGLGAPSTRSLASLRLSPVMARTSLITSIFFSPNEART